MGNVQCACRGGRERKGGATAHYMSTPRHESNADSDGAEKRRLHAAPIEKQAPQPIGHSRSVEMREVSPSARLATLKKPEAETVVLKGSAAVTTHEQVELVSKGGAQEQTLTPGQILKHILTSSPGHDARDGPGWARAPCADPVFDFIKETCTKNWLPDQRPLVAGEVFICDDNISEVQIDRVVGRGNFGIVYRGRFQGKNVAVKEITIPESCDEVEELVDLVQDWKDELEVCSLLDHPCLVRTLGYAKTPALIIVQELVAKGSLYDLFSAGFRPDGEQQFTMSKDIADGMRYLHGQTPIIIHRDLKSLNLLVTEDNRIKIADFGLARTKALSNGVYGHTIGMTECGTPFWSAPELLKGDVYNEKVDQYAFAMCVLELLTASTPWPASMSPMKCMVDVNAGKRPALPASTHQLLASLIKDCWAHAPADRPTFAKICDVLCAACTRQCWGDGRE